MLQQPIHCGPFLRTLQAADFDLSAIRAEVRVWCPGCRKRWAIPNDVEFELATLLGFLTHRRTGCQGRA